MTTMPHAVGAAGARIPSRASAPEASTSFSCVACNHDFAGSRPVVFARPPARPFELWRCDGCGLVQQHPRWHAARLASLYDSDNDAASGQEEQRWSRAVQQYVVHLARLESGMQTQPRPLTVNGPSRGATAVPQGLRLLDAGCRQGHLAMLARQRGWRVTGIDMSADAVSHAAVRFGLDVRAGSLSSHVGTLAPFNVVLVSNLIERTTDPVRLLNDVRKVLSPGGTLCIETPNWSARWRRWGRASWVGLYDNPVNLFDADSLSRVLTSCGFHDISASSYTHSGYEGWSSRPEIRAWVEWVPRFIAWRINRFLENRRPSSQWPALRDRPPATIGETLENLTELGGAVCAPMPARLKGDNLVITALR